MKQTNKRNKYKTGAVKVQNPYVIPKATTKNAHGFPAYLRDVDEQVVQMLTVGTLGNTYYQSSEKNLEVAIETFKNCKDNEFLAKAILYARNEGFARAMPIIALAVLSTKDVSLYKQIAPAVCRNPHDWETFIDICRSKSVRKGIGRALKTTMIDNIRQMKPYHAMKYPQAVRDMVNVSRPDLHVNPSIISYVKDGESRYYEDTVLGEVKMLSTLGEVEQAKSIVRNNIPFEVATSYIGKSKAGWNALLVNAPYFNMIRNLNNFGKYGLFDDRANIDYVCSVITNIDQMKKAKVYPFRLYSAWKFADSTVPQEVKNALVNAINMCALETAPQFKGKNVVIASDCSGSMSSNVTDDNSVIQCTDVCGLLSAMVLKMNPKSHALPFETSVSMDFKHDVDTAVKENKSVLEIAGCFKARGGTSLSAPLEYMGRNNMRPDVFIGITDNCEWAGSPFISHWKHYVANVNKNAVAYLIQLMPYKEVAAPSSEESVHFIYGWNDNVLKYLTFNRREQLNEIYSSKLTDYVRHSKTTD